MARLDYLGSAKETAQIGSVLGRSFSRSLLSAIVGQTEEQLGKALNQLIVSGLMLAEKTPSETTYTFKHALIQEAAYGSLLKSRRRELHRATAQALKEKFSELAKQRPELVAHHLTEAGEAEKAIEAWQEAGDFALARAALVEANLHYNKALEILKTLPDSPDRAQMELPLQISLGHIVTATKGFGSAEEEQTYSRARELAEQLDDSPQFFFILIGLWSTANSRSDIKASQELADEMLRIAERENQSMYLVWAYFVHALDSYEMGQFPEVGKWVEKMLQNYKAEELSWAPFDPKITVLNHRALALWHLGQIDRAREVLQESFTHASTLPPANMAMSHLSACCLYTYLRDPKAMLESAEAMLEIAKEEQLPSFLAWSSMYRGISHAFLGEPESGVAELKNGLAEYLASGTHSSLGQYLSLLAEAQVLAGDIDEALATIQDAFGAAPEEEMHLPELHRVRADILWKGTNPDLEVIEDGYRQAIQASQKCGSLAQELRAVTRLGRLLQSQGRGDEARALLAPLYAEFTEGLDTPDLEDARKLLDELSVNESS